MKRPVKSTNAKTRLTRAEKLRLGKEYMHLVLEDREWTVEEESPGTIAAREGRAAMNKWTREQRRQMAKRAGDILRGFGFVIAPGEGPGGSPVYVKEQIGKAHK
jgi:hypothetical protein